MTIRLTGLAIAGMSMMGAGAQLAQAEVVDDPLIRGFKNGRGIVDVRVRYEEVDDDNFDDRAKGLTMRTRLGYQTAPMAGFRLLGEFSNTRTLFGVNEFTPEDPSDPPIYPTIADPSSTVVNRAFISYEAFDQLLWLAGGRQRIKLDNDRWIGNVGWRQREQTFDAASIDLDIASSWALSYDYVEGVQGITDAFNRDMRDHFVNLAFTGWNAGRLVAYGYWLDDQDTDDKSQSYGLRFTGGVSPGSVSFLYTAEYARQNAELPSGNDFSADYYTLVGGIGVGAVTFKLGYEVLGSDGGEYGLQTLLATKHAFNGWADLFLGTPETGLRDAYFDVSAKWLGIKWAAIYHDFQADSGSDRYGTELDLLIAKKFNEHYTLGIKYADFKVDSDVEDQTRFRDVSKFWVWFDFKY